MPPDPARVSRLRSRLATARPDLLVVSGDEAESMLGSRRADALAAATGLAELAPVVIVTAAADGSAGVAGGTHCRDGGATTLPGPMLDATGSGDAYVAALIIGLAHPRTWPPNEGALRAAMESASRLGAQVSRVVGAQGRVPGEATAP